MTMITPSYLGETIEYSSLHACRSTLEDPTNCQFPVEKPASRAFCTISRTLSSSKTGKRRRKMPVGRNEVRHDRPFSLAEIFINRIRFNHFGKNDEFGGGGGGVEQSYYSNRGTSRSPRDVRIDRGEPWSTSVERDDSRARPADLTDSSGA